MADGEGAAVRKALTEAAESLGKNVGSDAGRAFRNLYKDSKSKIEQVIKRTAESDAESAGKLQKIIADMKANAESDAGKATKLENQTNLYQKFKSILDPGREEAEGGKLASDVLKPPQGEGKVPWIGGDGKNGSLLGHLPEDAVERDGDLITHVKVGGEKVPVDDYVKNLADERRAMYQDAQQAGTFSKGDTGAAMAVGVDRRTGAVYEGFNGRPNVDVIPSEDIHDTLGQRVEQMEQNGPYPSRTGGEPMKYPADDNPYGHAEVKAANSMLNARQDAGLPSGPGALSEMSFAPQFPFAKVNPEARTCPNCTAILDGAHLLYGSRASYGD